MSQHKTGSTLTPEQKELYWKRRERGLRGMIGYANVTSVQKDTDGVDHIVPVGFMRRPRGKAPRR